MLCIRVGRRHIFYRALDLLTSCACTDLSAGASTTVLPNSTHLSRRCLDSKLCRLEGTEMIRPPLLPLAQLRATFVVLRLSHRRATCRLSRHLLPRAAHPEDTSSFCFFWCFLVHTLCLCDFSILYLHIHSLCTYAIT
jgi:hypothetical protein